ncbi:MAG TPA: HDOD domain-containing protein [Candidatus Binatia bacterium]|nr:HDOD domain-containing protein [Candidatus Binatia bacterium]
MADPALALRVASQRPAWDSAPSSPALERFYRELMAVDELPSSPEVAQKMLVTINRETASTRDLAALIGRDQSLAARLLRLANSSFFATRARVESIQQAVTLLGFARVRDIVLGLSVWGALDRKSTSGRRYRKILWRHAATVAGAAKTLADLAGLDGGQAFTAGVLHDVGKLVLGLRLGESYWSMLDEAAERQATTAAVELEAFGCHHATVGGWLLQLWRLPPTLVDPVAHHHEALAAEFGLDLSNVIGMADRLVSATDPETGAAHAEALEEVHAFAPGFLAKEHWAELYGGLRNDPALALFDA